MALNAGSVLVKFTSDLSNFKQGLNQARTGLANLSGGLKAVGGNLATIGSKLISLPTLILGAGLGKLAIDTVNAGAKFVRLEATLESVRKTTGMTTDEIKNMRQELADANLYGAQATETLLTFTQSGLGSLTDMKKFTLMAKDFSASIGVSSMQGVQDFTKALGTLRPELLDKYRLTFNLNEVYSKYADGLGKTVTELTSVEKRTALLDHLYSEHEKTVKGVYKETYDTAGKAISSFGDALQALRDYAGAIFEPALREIFVGLRDVVQGWLQWFIDNQETVKQWGDKVKDVALQVAQGIGQLITFLINNKEIVLGFFGAIALAVGALVVAWVVANATLIATFVAVWAIISAVIKAWNSDFLGFKTLIIGVIERLTELFYEYKDEFIYIWNGIKDFITWIGNQIKAFWERWGELITTIFRENLNVLGSLIRNGFNIIIGIIKFVIAIFKGDWTTAWNELKRIFNSGLDFLKTVFNAIKNIAEAGMRAVYNAITGWLGKAWEKAKEIANKIREAISKAFDKDKRNSPSIMDRLKDVRDSTEKILGSIAIPNFSSQIASSLAGVNVGALAVGGESGTSKVVNQYITANVSDTIDINTLTEQLAFKARTIT